MIITDRIINQAKNGDKQAIEAIWKRYAGLSYYRAYRYAIPDYLKEDLVQEGHIGILEAARGFQKSKVRKFINFVSYCIQDKQKILCAKLNRRSRARGTPELVYYNIDAMRNRVDEPEPMQYDPLYKALNRLPSNDRKLIKQAYGVKVSQVSNKELARLNNLDPGNATRKKQKILKTLRAILEKQNIMKTDDLG